MELRVVTSIKPIWRRISHPFRFRSNQTIVTELQVEVDASNNDTRHPVEDRKRSGKEVDTTNNDSTLPIQEPRRGNQEVDATNDDQRHPLEEPKRRDDEVVDADHMLESRKVVMEQVLLALKVPVNKICVLGRAGVGKTMLVKNVALRVTKENLFDVIVFATVTRNPDIRRIQGEIANGLGFKFNEVETIAERADRLRHRLREKQKVLLILDDIWKRSHLEVDGIPYDHKGLTLLMTLSSDHISGYEMGTDQSSFLHLLEEGEAWSLFEKTLGHEIIDPTMQSIAHQVAKRCQRWPIVLVVVATALKGADLYAWRNALEQLTRFDNRRFYGKAFSALELSYNILLRGEEIKSLFLLCAFFEPNFISIEDLFKYAWGMGMFRQSRALEDARNRLYKLLDDLKASSFLLKGDDNSMVRMHDVVRNFAISNACRDHRIFTSLYPHTLFASWAFENVPEECKALCFHLDNTPMLEKTLKFPKLELLVLVSPNPLLKLPEMFFAELKALEVLNLTNMNFSSLPSSLAYIKNLRTLCLHFCNLEDISMVEELKNLRVLSLANSNIVQLPRQIAQLKGLQILDLTSCQNLEMIPSNILSCLTRLEELHLGNSFNQWEVGGLDSQGKNANLDELKHLTNLHTLDIHIRDDIMLPRNLFSRKLENFKIFIGNLWDWSGYETSKTLKLKLNLDIQLEESGIKPLLKKAEELHLYGQLGIRSILIELDDEGFPLLKHLCIQNNSEIQSIIKSVSMSPNLAFPRLETLLLSNLDNLENICDGQLVEDSFLNLKELEVEFCGKLRNLFSVSIAKRLVQLEEINVSYCESMEEIVVVTTESSIDHDGSVNLAHLRTLKLCGLPKLRSFFIKEVNASSASHNDNKIEMHVPMPLFNDKVLLERLESLFLSNLNSLGMICDGPVGEESLANLKKLEVKFCDNMRNLFSISTAKGLIQLEEIIVSHCESMEEIVSMTTESGVDHDGLVNLIHLRMLKLRGLPKLRI